MKLFLQKIDYYYYFFPKYTNAKLKTDEEGEEKRRFGPIKSEEAPKEVAWKQ